MRTRSSVGPNLSKASIQHWKACPQSWAPNIAKAADTEPNFALALYETNIITQKTTYIFCPQYRNQTKISRILSYLTHKARLLFKSVLPYNADSLDINYLGI